MTKREKQKQEEEDNRIIHILTLNLQTKVTILSVTFTGNINILLFLGMNKLVFFEMLESGFRCVKVPLPRAEYL